jgi:hypothetical protein
MNDTCVEPLEQLFPGSAKGGLGFQYPSATYHDGKLYVAYSVSRDFLEVSVLDLAQVSTKR